MPLVQIVPGSRAAGPARTVRCGQDDNLMVHAAVAEALPGRGARPHDAGAHSNRPRRRPPRDAGEETRGRRDPGRRRRSRRRGSARARSTDLGTTRPRQRCGEAALPAPSASRSRSRGATIRQGDVVVLDIDGAVVVEHERVEEVLAAGSRSCRARARQAGAARDGRALLRPGRPSPPRGAVSEPIHDLARIGHAELLTPNRREPALLRRRPRNGRGGTRRAVGLPAGLGRLPPVQA